jgi:uncharacterized protein YegL
MSEMEHSSNAPKHRAVAQMVQRLINSLCESIEHYDTRLTVIAFDSNDPGHVLLDNDIAEFRHYYLEYDPQPEDPRLTKWDPLPGHGGANALGAALAMAGKVAEKWILEGDPFCYLRATVFILSDGQYRFPSSSLQETIAQIEAVKQFNHDHRTVGRVRIAAVGYLQDHPDNCESEESLRVLVTNQQAYFKAADSRLVRDYIFNDMSWSCS